jgi:hypothetical protein
VGTLLLRRNSISSLASQGYSWKNAWLRIAIDFVGSSNAKDARDRIALDNFPDRYFPCICRSWSEHARTDPGAAAMCRHFCWGMASSAHCCGIGSE